MNKLSAHDKRKRREKHWVGIIIHHTGIGGRKVISEALWARLYRNITAYLGAKDKNYVSAHYTIGRHGETTELVDPKEYEAFHAGKSTHWCGYHRRIVSDWNRSAIGIELIGDGNIHEYSEEQYEALIDLCCYLVATHDTIHPLNILGHEAISPGRKDDPGKFFDWNYLFEGIYHSVQD